LLFGVGLVGRMASQTGVASFHRAPQGRGCLPLLFAGAVELRIPTLRKLDGEHAIDLTWRGQRVRENRGRQFIASPASAYYGVGIPREDVSRSLLKDGWICESHSRAMVR
jgi:hypothetical protein